MIERVSSNIEVFTLNEMSDINQAVDAITGGKITLLKVGSVFSFVYDPSVEGLTEKVSVLKGRRSDQMMSVVCAYEQAKQFADKDRINQDFFSLPPGFCGKVILNIPVKKDAGLPFPYNTKNDTTQFLSFEQTHPIREALLKALAERGCEYLSITSGNITGAPTIEDVGSAKQLAALINIKASFLGIEAAETVVTDIPADKGGHKGSFIILSFCDPEAIEVRRLANKADREVTERYLKELFSGIDTKTPLVYAV